MSGYIYVFHVDHYNLDNKIVYKIGNCSNFDNRRKDFVTCYFNNLKLDYLSDFIPNVKIVEKNIHKRLSNDRINNRREFFTTDIYMIKNIIQEEINKNYFTILPFNINNINEKKKNKNKDKNNKEIINDNNFDKEKINLIF